MKSYTNDPPIAQFDGHPGRTYEVRQDQNGYYVTRTDKTTGSLPVFPDHMAADESFDTEGAAYWYAQGCADGDRRA